MPKQMPRNGILFSRTCWIATSLPFTPRAPKPGATSTPSTSSSADSPSVSIRSESTRTTSTATSWKMPAWPIASLIEMYASLSSTYLPTSATLTRPRGFWMRSAIALHSSSCGGLVCKRRRATAMSAKPSASKLSGTW